MHSKYGPKWERLYNFTPQKANTVGPSSVPFQLQSFLRAITPPSRIISQDPSSSDLSVYYLPE